MAWRLGTEKKLVTPVSSLCCLSGLAIFLPRHLLALFSEQVRLCNIKLLSNVIPDLVALCLPSALSLFQVPQSDVGSEGASTSGRETVSHNY